VTGSDGPALPRLRKLRSRIALSFRIPVTVLNFLTITSTLNMGVKPPHDGDKKSSVRTHKKGFKIGPANLPDGTHRRKSRCFRSFWRVVYALRKEDL
jgi:hypothetical protein